VSAITARTKLADASFESAWRNEPTGTVFAIVELGGRDAHLTFDSPAEARHLAAELIKAAEAMERLTAGPAKGEAGDGGS